MDRDEVALADELVELEAVDVAGLACERCVDDEEDVLVVGVDRGHEGALAAGAHDHGVGVEHPRQHGLVLVADLGQVDPDEAVATQLQQRLEICGRMVADPVPAHEGDPHGLQGGTGPPG